jgi:hypothetical protein
MMLHIRLSCFLIMVQVLDEVLSLKKFRVMMAILVTMPRHVMRTSIAMQTSITMQSRVIRPPTPSKAHHPLCGPLVARVLNPVLDRMSQPMAPLSQSTLSLLTLSHDLQHHNLLLVESRHGFSKGSDTLASERMVLSRG